MKFPGFKKQEVNLNFHKLQSVQITALNGHAKDALVFWKRAPLICLSFPILVRVVWHQSLVAMNRANRHPQSTCKDPVK